MFTRNERFDRIRTELLEPKLQKPTPDLILKKMLQFEQTLNLNLTNTRQPWSLVPFLLISVIGQTEYDIPNPVSGNNSAGKIYSVLRSTNEERLPFVPVNYEDFSSQSFGAMPLSVNDRGFTPEKISVFRLNSDSQTLKLVLQPTPKEVLSYKFYFYPGALDRVEAAMSDSHGLAELTDFLDLKTQLSLLPACEWQGYSTDQNMARKKELAASFAWQIEELQEIVDEYIDQIGSPQTFEMGTWRN